VPSFGIVAGVSLGAACRMRLRAFPHVKHAKTRALVLELAPRSAYVMRDDARWRWQHAISPTKALRYSVTFRTLRRA
jgi:alkylated DNA repair dioxygenase AlkB